MEPIKVKNGYIFNQQLLMNLQEISNAKTDPKTAYWIGKIVKKVMTKAAQLDKFRLDKLNEFAKKDEEGKPIVENGRFKIENESVYQEVVTKMMEEEFDLEIPKQTIYIENIKLSANDIDLIEPFFDISTNA